MKIGVYLEHGVGNGVGGAELVTAYLASAWSRYHDVDLIHHRPSLTRERLARFSTDDYGRVNVRCLACEREPLAFANPFQRYRAARARHRHVSAQYDLFVNCTYGLPAFCHAPVGALLVLFPSYVRPGDTAEMRQLPPWKRARHAAYYDFEWRRRLATYQHRFAISEFSCDWTRRRWGIACEVVYPPVDVEFADTHKAPLVLSVGRFSTNAHAKKQVEMMRAFRELTGGSSTPWTYASVGSLNASLENRGYFEQVREAGRGCPAVVEANLDRRAVRSLFERARIFWQATGLNENTDAYPELAEHFGIATVEAMAAGCVPVVIDKGGQREIIDHGENGYLWETLEELKAYTRRLITDDALWQRMSAAARQRAMRFARERFLDRLSTACQVSNHSWTPADAPAPSLRASAR